MIAADSETALQAQFASAEPTPVELIGQVARFFGLSVRQIRGGSREPSIARVRFLLYRLFLDRGNSSPQIGRWMKRDHSTVLHGRDRFRDVAKHDRSIAAAYVHFRHEWGLDDAGAAS